MTSVPSADQVVAGLPEAVLIISDNNEILAINPAAENLFGTSSKHVVGNMLNQEVESENLRLSDVFANEDTAILAHDVAVTIRGQKYFVDIGVTNVPANPRFRIVSMLPKPTSHNGTREFLEKAGDFGIAAPEVLGHEIKNPLAAIRGSAQLIARIGNDDTRSHSDLIIAEVDRIARLIDRMQNLSSSQPAKIQAINIHELIEHARRSISRTSTIDIEFHSDFDPSLPDVLVDPDAMLQVLTNLLANAIDAVSSVEEPKIEIATRFSFGGRYAVGNAPEAPKLPIEIVLRDNGPGVPEDLSGQIFAPFVTTKSQGQGLGLALVRKLLFDMKGHITYDRVEPGRWTEFTIYLPAVSKAKS